MQITIYIAYFISTIKICIFFIFFMFIGTELITTMERTPST